MTAPRPPSTALTRGTLRRSPSAPPHCAAWRTWSLSRSSWTTGGWVTVH